MDRKDIEAYFSRKQREVTKVKLIEPNKFRVFRPVVQHTDQSPEAGAWLLRARGWSVSGIARVLKISWHKANRLIKQGQEKIEEEIGITIDVESG